MPARGCPSPAEAGARPSATLAPVPIWLSPLRYRSAPVGRVDSALVLAVLVVPRRPAWHNGGPPPARSLMSYLVLARKWRPKRFAELVGQKHVVRSLSNALDSGRVHHAFLFTGTRGVGKTTIARIFAKSLNCETGVGAEPCGVCAICTAVDAGRFVDLIEIDAASHTGVDDVRELIDNAQYMPTRGRYKVYLIDEVHMLSRNAFNALLKTLEEPPEHVKFLLATTDPQKLPVTVLSRCLQFNLKRLTTEQIAAQMRMILAAEVIAFDEGAIAQLAHGADGSLRDGLSLLDQAIAFGGGSLRNEDVATMLGTVDRSQVGTLLAALATGDGPALLEAGDRLADFSPDFGAVLDAMAEALHGIQLQQLVPAAADATDDSAALAEQVSAELVQLWYQMVLGGRRELPLAPSPRIGFEMTLLRMLAFQPHGAGRQAAAGTRADSGAAAVTNAPRMKATLPAAPAALSVAHAPSPMAASAPPRREPSAPAAAAASVREAGPAVVLPDAVPIAARADAPAMVVPAAALGNGEDWLQLIASIGLKGPLRELAANAAFVSYLGSTLRLSLPDALDHLRNPSLVQQLTTALAAPLGEAPQIEFVTSRPTSETLNERTRRERDMRQADAERAFLADPSVQHLMHRYDARLVPDSIRPADDTRSQE
jgi:DNA polymerase III subunit gamma/tau